MYINLCRHRPVHRLGLRPESVYLFLPCSRQLERSSQQVTAMWKMLACRSFVRTSLHPRGGGMNLNLSNAKAGSRYFVEGYSLPLVFVRRGYSADFTQSATSTVALKLPPARQLTLTEKIHALPEVQPDDLPITSMGDRKVAIGWDTRTWSRFHHIWLRDHCRCPKCFHSVTKQRLVNTFEIPPDIKPIHLESKPEGLEVTWHASEPHVSLYPWPWLQANSYDPSIQTHNVLKEPVVWGCKIDQAPPSVTYEEAMTNDDRGLFKWLSNIDRFGFCFIHGVPSTAQATEELSNRIGFIRETHYGKFWDFTADLAKGDTAYTTLALGAHTDNTYFTDPCGIQLFHLLSHEGGTGGATLLVDGFYVASILRELRPEVYDLLSRVPVPAHAAGEPSTLYRPSPPSGYPVLNHDPVTGALTQVRWNNDDRSVMNALDPYLVEEWYNAIRTWHKFLTSPDSEYWVQLTPGTVVVINNHRVLHGRSAFDGKRRMCGAYIGMDEYRSKLSVLSEKFGVDSVTPPPGSGNDAIPKERSSWNLMF